MPDQGPFEFIVTIWGTKRAAQKILEQFIDRHEDFVMEATMEGRRLPDMNMSVSTIRRSKQG